MKEQLNKYADSWRLMERLIGIRVCNMQVEVLFYPTRKIPKAWDMAELSGLGVCPMFGLHE